MSNDRIAAVLRETAGLEADALGARHLAEAVRRMMARAGIDAESYAARIAADAATRELLIGDLLVHETSFFRYPESFRNLASLAAARTSTRPGPFRVLSAACATGQEAYSAAIALLEAGLPPERVSIDAFDRSEAAIATARAGRYDRGGKRGLDAERAARWFTTGDGTVEVLPDVRALVRFETGSLLALDRPFQSTTYDAVFCRNLLIYLTEDARRRALSILRAWLAPDGVLYLGHAEVLVARAQGFAPLSGAATYACVEATLPVARPTAAAPRPHASSRAAPAAPPRVANAPKSAVPTPPSPKSPAPKPPTPKLSDPLLEARTLADAGRLDEACALLETEVSHGRPSADHYHLLALIRRAAGQARESDEALSRALYLDPTHAGALLLAAVAAEGRGERAVAARLHARARAAITGKG